MLTELEKQLAGALWDCDAILAIAATGVVITGPVVDKAKEKTKAALAIAWEKEQEAKLDRPVVDPLLLEARDAMNDARNPEGDYYSGLRCGVEDRTIHDRYEAAEFGWDQAFEYIDSALDGTRTKLDEALK